MSHSRPEKYVGYRRGWSCPQALQCAEELLAKGDVPVVDVDLKGDFDTIQAQGSTVETGLAEDTPALLRSMIGPHLIGKLHAG